MKKVFTLLLALTMLLGCSSVAFAENDTINVMVSYRDVDELQFGEMPYFFDPVNGINVQSGVTPNFNQIKNSDWSTKLNLMFASGNYPDVIVRGDVNTEMYGVDQEILVPLDDYIAKYMPNYKALLDADPNLARSLKSSNGKMYKIGWLIPQNINTDSHLFINKTWLTNVGKEVPTTIEEYADALRAFRDMDADGDGDATNEIPLGGTFGSMVDSVLFMLCDWGIPFNYRYISIDDNGKTYSMLGHENLRAALETISAWYNEGLIDIEAVSQDDNAFEAKVNACNYGSFWRWRMTALGTDESVYSQYVCMLPTAADGYKVTLPCYIEVPSFGAAITVAAEQNGNVEAVCRWLDTQFEFENMINGYNGMKGEFWDYNAEGIVELFPMSDGTRTVPGQSSMYYMNGNDYFAKVAMPSHRIEKTSYCQWYTENDMIEKNSWRILTQLVTLTVEESQNIELRYAELSKYASEALTGFIVNGVTDESWDTYQQTLENLNLADYLATYQTAYDRYLEAN